MNQILQNYLAPILVAFILAWVVQFLFRRLIRRFIHVGDLAPGRWRLRRERTRTLTDLLSSTIAILAYVIAAFFTLSLFIDATTIIWMVGLFSAAFGIGANVLIRDFLTGFSFIFEDTIDVGDKVEILGIEGVVEKIHLRTMFVRATTGELYIIPNGEVRIIRNFSRGSFSTLSLTLVVHTAQLEETLQTLQELGKQALNELPNMIEPWTVLSTSDAVGEQTEFTLIVKTRYGKAAEARPRLVKFIQEHLSEAQIELVN
ncbi:MAG: mechanosensitive ion channel family protein [Chloroflexi bacterium]|nr:mechanosensitive ion channel family protein [Chloroflexota bacterium]